MKISFLLWIMLMNSTAFAAHRGGNGGHRLELFFKDRLNVIARFLDSDLGHQLFPEFVSKNFTETVAPITIKAAEADLYDRYDNKRCAVNFPEFNLIALDTRCFTMIWGRETNALVAHEIFNLIGVELPVNNSSIYPYSSRFLRIPEELVDPSVGTLFNQDCRLILDISHYPAELSNVAQAILQLKGYEDITGEQDQTYLAYLMWLKIIQNAQQTAITLSHRGTVLYQYKSTTAAHESWADQLYLLLLKLPNCH